MRLIWRRQKSGRTIRALFQADHQFAPVAVIKRRGKNRYSIKYGLLCRTVYDTEGIELMAVKAIAILLVKNS